MSRAKCCSLLLSAPCSVGPSAAAGWRHSCKLVPCWIGCASRHRARPDVAMLICLVGCLPYHTYLCVCIGWHAPLICLLSVRCAHKQQTVGCCGSTSCDSSHACCSCNLCHLPCWRCSFTVLIPSMRLVAQAQAHFQAPSPAMHVCGQSSNRGDPVFGDSCCICIALTHITSCFCHLCIVQPGKRPLMYVCAALVRSTSARRQLQ
jgi:hypothetical protein